MRRTVGAARRVLVVAPHPDDEVIGAWALMRSLIRQGANVDVLIVSDGGASHPESTSWPPARLVSERRRETLRAMAALSIPPSRVHFLKQPDGALERCAPELHRAIGRFVGKLAAPDLIVGPVANDDHGDHRAVAHALASLPRRGARRLGYGVWVGRNALSAPAVRIRLDSQAMAAKRRAIRSYRTQSGVITDAKAGFSMTVRHLRQFVRPFERFEEQR